MQRNENFHSIVFSSSLNYTVTGCSKTMLIDVCQCHFINFSLSLFYKLKINLLVFDHSVNKVSLFSIMMSLSYLKIEIKKCVRHDIVCQSLKKKISQFHKRWILIINHVSIENDWANVYN